MTKTILHYEHKITILEHYEVEFKVKGLASCKPDTFLTGEMKLSRKNIDDHEFSILIAEKGIDSNEAVNTARLRLNMYFDYYHLFFGTPLQIRNNGEPFSVTVVKDGKIVAESYPVRLTIGPIFMVSEEIKSHAINVLTLLTKPENGYLSVAIDYHRRAALEQDGTNELIHLFIALEALYATENEKMEIQHKLSSRIATLLGKDKDDRIAIRKRAKKLYTIRSKIVHGSQKFDADNIEDVVTWVQESILRFLVLANNRPEKKHEDIIELVDDAMLENELRDKIREESDELIKEMEETKAKAKEESEKMKKSQEKEKEED